MRFGGGSWGKLLVLGFLELKLAEFVGVCYERERGGLFDFRDFDEFFEG